MADVYTILHHLVEKSGARDEKHLSDLHDTITAHQLGFSSLEELRAEQRRQLAAIDPAAAARAQADAFELLKTVREQQRLIEQLLSQAQAYQQAQQAQAEQGVQEAQSAAGAPAPIFQQPAAPAAPAADTPPPPLTPALGRAPAIPVVQEAGDGASSAPAAPAAPARPTVPLPPTVQP